MPIDIIEFPLRDFPVLPGTRGSINDPEHPHYNPLAPFRDSSGTPIVVDDTPPVLEVMTVEEFNDPLPLLTLSLPFIPGSSVDETRDDLWAWELPNGQYLVYDEASRADLHDADGEGTFTLFPEPEGGGD